MAKRPKKFDPHKGEFSDLPYEAPAKFPFWNYDEIAFDIETRDPDLTTMGTGARRRDEHGKPCAELVGVALRTRDGRGGYYPFGHALYPEQNDLGIVPWLREGFSKFRGTVLGANLLYDFDVIDALFDIRPGQGVKFRDVQFAAPLLDENAEGYDLDTLLRTYLNKGKAKAGIFDIYGPGYIENMDQVHPAHAAEYALGDVDPLFELHDKLMWQMESDRRLAPFKHSLPLYETEEANLSTLYDLECRQYPLLLDMRRRGVQVDTEHAAKLSEQYSADTAEAFEKLASLDLKGFDFDAFPKSAAGPAVGLLLEHLGHKLPRTPGGKISVRQQWLDQNKDDPAVEAILRIRRNEKFVGTFLKSYVLKHGAGGLIHCQFHPLRSDEYGTVSGRYSSSHPNLQNIPSRDPVLGPLCRALFIPAPGRLWWSKDYSQIEYRFLVHYANLICDSREGKLSAQEAMYAYINDPKTDFHKVAAGITGVDRKAAKNINFGVVYGMGAGKMARSLGVDEVKGLELLNLFHEKMPFMRETSRAVTKFAERNGFITTIAGRRRRFEEYEYYHDGQRFTGANEAEVKERAEDELKVSIDPWRIKRAFAYKGLNSLLQGGAADMMKKAMVNAWEAGLFSDSTGVDCRLTVHDELNGECEDTAQAREVLAEIDRVMSTAIPLRVPVYADGGVGANWKEAKG